MNTKHSSYLESVFASPSKFNSTVRKTTKMIRDAVQSGTIQDFSHIACRGVSGVTIAAPIALRLKKGLIVVRKQEDDCHASLKVEGVPDEQFSYLIVDDLIESGKTIMRIVSGICKYNRFNNLVGAALYHKYHEGIKTAEYLTDLELEGRNLP